MTFKPDLSSVVTSLIGILALGACGGVSPAPRTDGGGGRSGADGGRVTDAVLNPSDAGGLGGASGQGGMGAGGGQGGASGDGGQEVGSGQGGADAGGGQGGAVVADGSVDVQAQSSPDVAPDSVSGAPDLGVEMEAGTTLDVAPLPPADAATSQDLPMESSAAASPLMIEDFEDCDGQIITQEGRRGTWYSYLDDYGIGSTLSPDLQKVAFVAASGGKPGSERCSGQWVGVTKVGMVDGQTKYGYAGVGFAFNDGANYDASAYGGIGLWLKGSGKVTLTLRNATAEYGADTITLAGDWTYAVLPWSSFRRTVKVGNDDVVEVIGPSTLRNLQVNFPSDDVFTSVIDDIAFLPLPSTPDGGTDAAPAPSDGSAAGDADAGTDVAAGLSLIDDVEDCDLTIPMRDGRAGNWSANKDSLDLVTRLTTSAVAGGTPASPTCSLQSTGMIGPDQWAHLDLSLNNGGDYDASSYLGLSFWAKGHGTINIEVATSGTIPTGSGGTCASPSGGADIHCDWWNHYQKSITLADTWQNFQVRWDDVNFTRPVGPVAGGFDPHKIRWVQWDFGGGDAVDMTLDDVAFLKASP